MTSKIPRDRIKHLEWVPGMELPKIQNTGSASGGATPPGIIVQSTADFWTISGVHYRDGIYDVDLAKTLLDEGNAKTQDEWSAYAREAQAKGEFYTESMPKHHALLTAAYKLEDNPMKEEIKEFLKKSMFERWLTTLTRVQYQPQGSLEDVIIHSRGMPDEYSVIENFVFNDEYVKDSTRPSNYKALLEVDDLQEIQNVYQWLTDKNIYLWRVNERSDQVKERVAWFGAYFGWTGLNCVRDPAFHFASLGVRFVRRA